MCERRYHHSPEVVKTLDSRVIYSDIILKAVGVYFVHTITTATEANGVMMPDYINGT